MPESIVKPYRNKFKELRHEFESQGWRNHYDELAKYKSPMRGKSLSGGTNENDTNEGTKKFQKIINGSALNALRTFAAGLQGGLASPSRPWFKLAHGDRALNEFAPVKAWFEAVEKEMLLSFAQSNFYTAHYSVLYELGLFGTGAMFMPTDESRMMSYRPYTAGEYYIMLDHNYRPIGLYRDFYLTARQMVQRFGLENMSESSKQFVTANNKSSEKKIRIIHCVQPNKFFDPTKLDFRGMEFESVYFEWNIGGGQEDKFLSRGGFSTLPFVAPRFDVVGVDTYGIGPGMEALGDSKMLQKIEEKKLKGLDKSVDPPMTAPTSLINKRATQIAGGVTYVDTAQGQQGFQPAFLVRPDLQGAAFEIDRIERRIQRFFYNDLFLSIISQDKSMTATEVAQRHDEKLIMLGPVLERLQTEDLDPIVDRMFDNVVNSGRVPPPPPELEGVDLNIEYVSMLAQAQRIVGIGSIERTAQFVGNLANIWPEAALKFNAEEAVDIFSDAQGTPQGVVRTDDEVQAIKDAQAEAQARAEQQAQQQQAVESASKLAQIPTKDGGNLVSDIVGGGQGGA